MNLQLLRYFVTLAQERHFARAAERCSVAQPTLSAGLATLEQQLGKRLIQRDRRFVGLTEAGQAALPWAQQVLAACDGMAGAVIARTGPMRGQLRLGAIPAAMPLVGGVVRDIRAAHPALTVSVRSATSREIARDLAAFDLDAGLTYLDHEPPARMLSAPLYAERHILLVRADAGFDAGDGVDWKAVAGLPLCLLHQGMQNRRILDARVAAQGVALDPAVTADNYVALLALVQSGGFATLIPDSYRALLPEMPWARMHDVGDAAEVSRIGLIVFDRAPLSPLAGAALVVARGLF